MATKVNTPKGTKDILPDEMVNRNYVINIIKNQFKKFCFNQIETPSIENSSTLMGKYGEEGDKLIFKILNSGNYSKNIDKNLLDKQNKEDLNFLTNTISNKALRYDLTIPFARFVTQHQDKLHFPFKRYQIQPVWRAEKPQRGRLREFYQCDADIIGSKSLWQEVELIQLYDQVFNDLNLDVTIELNNRKILHGITEIIGEIDKITDITVALDKLDKIGAEKVKEEILSKGISKESVDKLSELIYIEGDNLEKVKTLKRILSTSEIGKEGIKELEFILDALANIKLKRAKIVFKITLARGLNYYTGSIFEVRSDYGDIGSIGGGGRYDNLTGVFGLKNISGVGISFGLERIYMILEQSKIFEKLDRNITQVLFLNLGELGALESMKYISILRENNINAEMFPDSQNIKKQISYANKRNIPFIAMIGDEELKSDFITVKNMSEAKQDRYTIDELLNIFSL
ncbi:histidine--tRNA ligase [Ichthyobacterium seriolicida]|uniref:Histidine--tRNA ligase n=1 Tax=Ichthyobacterium seriolicida TaxID=242600 RepID=A0A1J1DXG1_9FLAO|nr:histidine--tRNA ligase [Ichthyobacterium seriolicida]BAV94543.1 histidyl-tRNA synthetase [Ichthyobacterium seriolicida]